MSRIEIESLISQAESLDYYDPQRCHLAQRAERLAVEEGDTLLLLRVRGHLMGYLSNVERKEEALVALAWCFKHREQFQNLSEYDRYGFMWTLKNVFRGLVGLHTISIQQLDGLFEQLKSVYSEFGHGGQVVHLIQALAAIDTGRLETLNELRALVATTPRDLMSDCLACETDHRVRFAAVAGDDEGAFSIAQPILDGEQSCASVPERTYNKLLLPLLRLGRIDEAKRMHQTGWRKVNGKIQHVGNTAIHLGFAVRHGDHRLAWRLFENNVGLFAEITDHLDRHRFMVACEYLFESLLADGVPQKPGVELKRILPGMAQVEDLEKFDRHELAKYLHESFGEAARELAFKFDRRNGNDYVSRQVPAMIRFDSLPS